MCDLVTLPVEVDKYSHFSSKPIINFYVFSIKVIGNIRSRDKPLTTGQLTPLTQLRVSLGPRKIRP